MCNNQEIKLTKSQQRVFRQIKQFVGSDSARVFILKGYAGTGKTTMLRFLVEHLIHEGIGYHLLASTGRAAAILNKATGTHSIARTIHSLIYSYSRLNQDLSDQETINVDSVGQLYLVFSPIQIERKDEDDNKTRLYIIDEASMVSDMPETHITQAAFGTGRLLKELLDYDQAPNSKFLFVGDPCQLPPVNQAFSPALSAFYFSDTFSLTAQEAELTEIIRQADGNTITSVSHYFRRRYQSAPEDESFYGGRRNWVKMGIQSSRNIIFHSSRADLVGKYIQHVKKHGYESGTLICKYNKNRFLLANEVRAALGRSGAVAPNDLLLVMQNNHPSGLYNGDLVVVRSVSDDVHTRAELTFREVEVEDLATHTIRRTLLMEDLLYTGNNNLTSLQQSVLFVDFIQRMRKLGIRQNTRDFDDMLLQDEHLNALRCSFGYALTCHKAQGGEWDEVFIDLPRNIMLNPTQGTYQWLYTAFTRARKKVHIVNDPLYIMQARYWLSD